MQKVPQCTAWVPPCPATPNAATLPTAVSRRLAPTTFINGWKTLEDKRRDVERRRVARRAADRGEDKSHCQPPLRTRADEQSAPRPTLPTGDRP